ncbi:hypothetical protein ACWIDW_07120 [Microbacterium sp. NPDC055312]
MNARTALAASALIAAAGFSLTGCAVYEELVHQQSTHTFDDLAAFRAEADVDAPWIPADATDITVRTSTSESSDDAVILLTGDFALAGDCTDVERRSAPVWTLDGASDPYAGKTVFACGDWSVIPADDGWFGWTPNSDAERADARGK